MKDIFQFLTLFTDGFRKFINLSREGKALVILVASTIITTFIGVNLISTRGLEWPAYGAGTDYVLPVIYLASWALLLIIGRNSRKVVIYSVCISGIQLLYIIALVTRSSLLGFMILFVPIVSPIAMMSNIMSVLLIMISIWFAGSVYLFILMQRRYDLTGKNNSE